jgi:hypothetical protein
VPVQPQEMSQVRCDQIAQERWLNGCFLFSQVKWHVLYRAKCRNFRVPVQRTGDGKGMCGRVLAAGVTKETCVFPDQMFVT